MEANEKKGSYPTAHLVSPMYYYGAYDCWFSFYYNMWHASSINSNDADIKLNVYYRKYGRDTLLGETRQNTDNQWQQFHMPSCPRDFNVSILCFFRIISLHDKYFMIFFSFVCIKFLKKTLKRRNNNI